MLQPLGVTTRDGTAHVLCSCHYSAAVRNSAMILENSSRAYGKGWGRGAELNLKPLFTTWREKKNPCLSDCLIQCCDQNTSVHNISGKTVIPTNRPQMTYRVLQYGIS